jgi:hypothetical protein
LPSRYRLYLPADLSQTREPLADIVRAANTSDTTARTMAMGSSTPRTWSGACATFGICTSNIELANVIWLSPKRRAMVGDILRAWSGIRLPIAVTVPVASRKVPTAIVNPPATASPDNDIAGEASRAPTRPVGAGVRVWLGCTPRQVRCVTGSEVGLAALTAAVGPVETSLCRPDSATVAIAFRSELPSVPNHGEAGLRGVRPR